MAVETFRVANGKQLETEFEVSNFGLAYGDEFLYIAKANSKLKAAKRRLYRKQERRENANGDHSIEDQANNFAQNEYDDDDDFGGGFDFGGDDDDHYDNGIDDNLGNTGIQSVDNLFREEGGGGSYDDGKSKIQTGCLFDMMALFCFSDFSFVSFCRLAFGQNV